MILIKHPLLDDTDAVVTPPTPSAGSATPAAAKVAVPRSPTKDELETEFKSDPEFEVEVKGEKPEVVVPTKKEEKPVKPLVPVVTKPAADKPVVAAPAVPQKQEAGPLLPPSATHKQRDYTGFSDEETRVLKAMSNESFAYASKVFKEAKELGKLKDAQFLQHPQAFTLDPAFRQLQEDASYMEQEANYWQGQLVEITEGRDWAPITGWTKEGKPILGEMRKPTTLDAEKVRMAMNQCFTGAQSSRQQLQQFATQYQQRVTADSMGIQQECARRFGWVADPKLLDQTMTIPDVGEKSLKQLKGEFTELFPPYLRNTVGVDVAGHMWIAMQIYAAQIRELQNGKAIAEDKAEEVVRAEPTSKASVPATGKAINGVSEFSMEGFPS